MVSQRKSGFIAIVGRPNVGKSTLLNRILGSNISIVTPKAQTTREKVLGILTEKEGQIVFIDTPGIHRARAGGINEFMVHQAKESLDGPSLIWYLVDPSSAAEHEKPVLELLKEAAGCPIFLIVNKYDLLDNGIPAEAFERLQETIPLAAQELGFSFKENFKLSSKAGEGVDELLQKSWALMPEGPLHYPDEEQISDRPVRFFVAEKIREQLLLKLGEELPYSCAVEIEKFDENAKLLRIEATIYVERESQKGMVIGKGGLKLKEIGQAARQKIEEFLDQEKIFLGLRVKVLKDWSKDAVALRRMGYNLPKAPAGQRRQA